MPTNDNIRAFRNYDDWKTSPPETPDPDEKVVCSECLEEISDERFERTEKLFLEDRAIYPEFDPDENILYSYGLCLDCYLEILEKRVIRNFKKLMES